MWLRTICTLCAVAVCLGGTGAALAVDAEPPDAPCANAENNLAYKECLGRLYEKADRELNVVWKQVLASVDRADYLTPKQRAAWKTELRQAQRAWVQFKEHDCNGAMLYEWWGGTGAGGAILACLLHRTVARTESLKGRYLEQR